MLKEDVAGETSTPRFVSHHVDREKSVCGTRFVSHDPRSVCFRQFGICRRPWAVHLFA